MQVLQLAVLSFFFIHPLISSHIQSLEIKRQDSGASLVKKDVPFCTENEARSFRAAVVCGSILSVFIVGTVYAQKANTMDVSNETQFSVDIKSQYNGRPIRTSHMDPKDLLRFNYVSEMNNFCAVVNGTETCASYHQLHGITGCIKRHVELTNGINGSYEFWVRKCGTEKRNLRGLESYSESALNSNFFELLKK